jgi:hypothetical protein
MMNLIVFVPSKNRKTRRLFEAIEKLELDAGLELHYSAGSLFRRLCQPAREIVAAVLVMTRREDFDEIFVLRELLVDIPLIIVLPHGNDDLVPRAHLLRPRFVSFWDQSLREVPAVLARMLRHAPGFQAEKTGLRLPGRKQALKETRWSKEKRGLLS